MPSSIRCGKGERKIREERIIRQIVNGDREKYALLIERYKNELYRIVYAILRHPKDAEDVLQEAFVQIFLSLPDYRGNGLKTWMARIAVNKAIDYKRKRYRSKEEPLLSQMEHFPPDEAMRERSDVGDDIVAKERISLIRRRIDELPEGYRDVVEAYFLKGKSYKEIAAATGQTVKSVESRLYRAKRWIRRHWKEDDFW